MTKARVLVVEDESIVSLEIQSRLRRLGYKVAGVVDTAEKAVEMADRLKPDLVLMDIQLKGQMDGVEAAAQIGDHLKIPVVYLTAYADEATLRRAKVTEPFGYILKPFEERELYKTIEMALSKHHMEQQLKERERWLDTTLKSIGDGVIATDTDGRITFLNAAAEKSTGWKFDQAKGRDLSEIFRIVNQMTKEPVENPTTAVLREGQSIHLANYLVLIARNEAEKPIDSTAAPIRGDNGQIVGVVLVFRDITDRMMATAEIQQRTHDLSERIKELKCLYRVSKLAQQPAITIEKIARDTVELIPRAMQYVEIACARITMGESTFCSKRFTETDWKISAPIIVNRKPVGTLEVCYLEERPAGNGRSFVAEEEELIVALAEHLGRTIQRKRFNEALEVEKAHLEALIQSAQEAIVMTDNDGQVLRINEEFTRLFGYTAAQAAGCHIDDLVAPGEKHREAQEVTRRVAQRERLSLEAIRYHKDGTPVQVSILGAPVIVGGEQVGVFGIYRDITERRRAADELKRQKALLDEVFNGIQEGIGIVDTDEIVTFCNPAYAEILDESVEDIIGKSLYDILPSHTHDIIREQSSIRRKSRTSTYDLPLTTSKGNKKFIRFTVAPRHSKDGSYAGAFGATMDITDRKIAEGELEKKTLQQAHLLQTARHLTESLDVKEVLTNIAQGAKEIIGAQGCSLYLLETDGATLTPVVAIDPNYEKEIMATALTVRDSFTGKAIQARRTLIFNDPQSDGSGKQIPGTPVEMEEKIIVAPLIADENVLGAMCLDRMETSFTKEDLSLAETFATYASTALKNAQTHDELHQEVRQRRRMEKKLKQTMTELKRSNDELQQFAYVASHDLQEPLRMVASYVQLLAKRYKGKLDQDADDFIGYAVDGAVRMQGLINDLLAYSRVGTRGRPFESSDLTEIFDQALANLQAAVVETKAQIDHGPLPTLLVDRVQFTQLFQNLIGNALKFHNAKPPRIHVAAEQNKEECILSVSDNGIGIDPEYAERIFMIFQRLHNRSEYKGSGIGLAICKKIVERHGGRIWVESKPDQGATFYFSVPLKGGQKS